MNRSKRLRGLGIALAVTLAAVSAPTRVLHPAVAPRAADISDTRVTERDVAASNAKVRMAYADLAGMWRARFAELGARFAVPRVVRYRGAARSSCGIMQPNNAAYCPRENTIYYDEVFVAAQAKAAALELGTDGDMAGIGVIAHEMGHAAAIQLGYGSPIVYENESIADCFAGAFARHADENGSLEPGDVEEAFFGMAAAADPTPELTGNRRIDRRIRTRAALMGHGTREQRMENFRAGLDGGARACVA
ncbi:MAG TPA: neutral zinc metallopeptidase [Gemmatimonadaceae bacterium]|jgi:predicted metalloprotease|nr:neutral zinc metallopeptidase [Gemmatimonadaceae bacterium]